MNGFSFIRDGLIQKPVGNNMANEQEDVFSVKRALSSLGRFGEEEPNGFITRGMDRSIKAFQRERGLKIDGILLPGGETESALLAGLRNANAGVSATAARQAPEEEQADPKTPPPPPPPRKPEQQEEYPNKGICEQTGRQIEDIRRKKGMLQSVYEAGREQIELLEVQLGQAEAELNRVAAAKILSRTPRIFMDRSDNNIVNMIQGIGVVSEVMESSEVQETRKKVESHRSTIARMESDQTAILQRIHEIEAELLTLELRQAENCR